MHATGTRLSTALLGLSAALLLMLAACDEPADQGTMAPAAGTDEPAATPDAPATEEQPAQQQ